MSKYILVTTVNLCFYYMESDYEGQIRFKEIKTSSTSGKYKANIHFYCPYLARGYILQYLKFIVMGSCIHFNLYML